MAVQDGWKMERLEAGNSAKRFLRQLRRAKGMRARPRGLSVGTREGAKTKKNFKGKVDGA